VSLVRTESVITDAYDRYLDAMNTLFGDVTFTGVVNWHEGENAPDRILTVHSNADTFDTYGHLFPNSRETAAKKLQQAMFTGRKDGFGSSLVAKPGKRKKKTEPPGDKD
jgi:hypothetical protein